MNAGRGVFTYILWDLFVTTRAGDFTRRQFFLWWLSFLGSTTKCSGRTHKGLWQRWEASVTLCLGSGNFWVALKAMCVSAVGRAWLSWHSSLVVLLLLFLPWCVWSLFGRLISLVGLPLFVDWRVTSQQQLISDGPHLFPLDNVRACPRDRSCQVSWTASKGAFHTVEAAGPHYWASTWASWASSCFRDYLNLGNGVGSKSLSHCLLPWL